MIKVIFDFSPAGLAASGMDREQVLDIFRAYVCKAGAVETEEGTFIKEGEDAFDFGIILVRFVKENLWVLDTVRSVMTDVDGEVADYKEIFLSFYKKNPWAKKYLPANRHD